MSLSSGTPRNSSASGLQSEESCRGRVALVTGAGSGLGRECALLLASAGAMVLVQDVDGEKVEGTCTLIARRGGRAEGMVSDIADVPKVRTELHVAARRLGPILILVNNAGISQYKPLDGINEGDFDRMLEVHVKGAFFATQCVVPDMRRERYGRIVNISSTWGQVGNVHSSHYCAAKAALLGLTKAWAKELAPHNVLVNAVAPGGMMTGMLTGAADREALNDEARAAVPLGRYAEPLEVAEVVLFLVSRAGSHFTGQVLCPNGGEVIVGI